MSQYNDSGTRTFTTAGAITRFSRVVLGSGGTITAADATSGDVGVAYAAAASGDEVTVILKSKSGTSKHIASAAIAAGVTLQAAAAGKIVTHSSGTLIGIAMEAAAADGDIIEVLRIA
jgi:hypothetical protein